MACWPPHLLLSAGFLGDLLEADYRVLAVTLGLLLILTLLYLLGHRNSL